MQQRAPRSTRSAATTGAKSRLLARGRPGARRPRDQRPGRAGSSRADGRSTARSRSSSAQLGRRRRRRDRLRPPAPHAETDPLRVVDLGCGNAYLTFAAHAWLSRVRGLPVRLVGVDVKDQSRRHNTALAERLGVARRGQLRASPGSARSSSSSRRTSSSRCTPATPPPTTRSPAPWAGRRPLVLAAPCCHQDISRQLRAHRRPRRTRC